MAKSSSAPNFILYKAEHWLALAAVVLALGFGLVIDMPNPATLHASGAYFDLEKVTSQEDLEKGLSGRAYLEPEDAMLFEFKTSDTWCFWMKDMNFPLDMVWLDVNRYVVYIQNNVSPNTFPETFCPTERAKYVVEVNAGLIKEIGLEVGDRVQF